MFLRLQSFFVIAFVFHQAQIYATDSIQNDSFESPIKYDPYLADTVTTPPTGSTLSAETQSPAESTTAAPTNVPKINKNSFKCMPNRVEMAWIPYGDDYDGFKIEFTTTQTPNEWYTNPEDTTNPFTVYKMNPGLTYKFRVRQIFKNGNVSPPSQPSEACTTKPDFLYKNPDNVKVEGGEPNELVISWTPISPLEHSGEGFYYNVFFKSHNSKEWKNEIINDWKQNTLVLKQLKYENWNVRVQCGNTKGPSKGKAEVHSGMPGEGYPTGKPTNFGVEVHKTDDINAELGSVTFTWEKIPENEFSGVPKGYKVRVSTSSNQNAIVFSTKYANPTKLTVNLPFDMQYTATIVAENSNGRLGPPSNNIYFRVAEGFPQPVADFKNSIFGSTAIVLQWIQPNVTNGKLIGYDINFKAAGMDEENLVIYNADANRIKLVDLKPDTKYTIRIAAQTATGVGHYKTIETRTKKAKKPAIPSFTYEFVNASNVHDGRITIHWKPNCCCQHGSQFYVKYQKDNETWQEEKPTYDNYYDLDLGHEAEKYEVMIVEVDDYFQTESDSQRITRNKAAEAKEPAKESNVQTIVIVVAIVLVVVLVIGIFTKCVLVKKCCPKEVV